MNFNLLQIGKYSVVFIMLFCRTNQAQNINFMFYNNNNEPVLLGNFVDDDHHQSDLMGCSSGDKLAIIVHGWRENCFTPWVPDLVKNLKNIRGGCIVCMDYNEFSRYSYHHLLSHFDGIAEVLTEKLRQFKQYQFEARKMFLFGFSFGGQLVLEAGRRFGVRQIQQIDACEPAGPGFDGNSTFQKQNVPQMSAINVQCIHTSSDKGTSRRLCHQNWMMGNCGWSQAAAGPRPLGSHGLCPYIYNSAFINGFPAIEKPTKCPSTDRVVPVEQMDSQYYMGYDEIRNNTITGDLFAMTFKEFPFNLQQQANLTHLANRLRRFKLA